MNDLRTVDLRVGYDFPCCDQATSLTASCRGLAQDLARAGFELRASTCC